MSDYTEKNSNLIPKIDIPCFAWNSQAEQGLLFFKAKSLIPLSPSSVNQSNSCKHDLSDMQMMSELLDNNTNHSTITVVYDLLHGILKL